MALRIQRELELGSGTRGFQFSEHDDAKSEQEVYDAGLVLERELSAAVPQPTQSSRLFWYPVRS